MKKNFMLLLFIATSILCACGSPQSVVESNLPPTSTVEPTVEQEETQTKYVEDIVVDHFISSFNENSQYEIADITKGNIRTKYFGHTNGIRLEMINATENTANCLVVKIYGENKEDKIQAMFDVFNEVLKVVDSSLTEDEISAAFQEVNKSEFLMEDFPIGENIIITYVPSKELSYGPSDARIDMNIYNF